VGDWDEQTVAMVSGGMHRALYLAPRRPAQVVAMVDLGVLLYVKRDEANTRAVFGEALRSAAVTTESLPSELAPLHVTASRADDPDAVARRAQRMLSMMLQYAGDEELAAKVRAVLHPVDGPAFIAAGGLPLLLATVSTYVNTNPQAVGWACGLLADAANDEATARSISDAGGVSTALSALSAHEEHPVALLQTARLLAALSKHDSLQEGIAASCAIPPAIATLSLHQDDGGIAAQLCCLLMRLCLTPANQETIGRVGVSVLMTIIKSPAHANSPDVLQWACGALYNACANNGANRDAARGGGGLTALQAVADRHRGTKAAEYASFAVKGLGAAAARSNPQRVSL
jgi:hypothetical protein